MIEVELPDGTVLEFPEGTPQEVMQRETKKFWQQRSSQTPSFSKPSQEDQELLDREMPKFDSDRTYTPTTLLQDPNAMQAIRKYMYDFHGTSPEVGDEEIVDNYLARMRKFSAGQSVVTLNELMSLKRSDKEGLQTAGQAYDIFDRMEGVFSDDYTWGETFEGLGSYARAVIVDPTNLIGLGLGRVIAGSGTKAGAFALKQIAREAAEQSMKRTLTQKFTQETAEKILTQGARGPAQKAALASAQQTARIAEREALRKAAANSAVSTALRSQARKEIAVATGVDTALALGVDYAYQTGMMMTGRQEEWSPFQSGLTALGGLGAGFLSAGIATSNRAIGRQSSQVLQNFQGYDASDTLARKAAENLGDSFVEDMQKNFTAFSERVAAGKSLTEEGDLVRGVNEQEFFRAFVLGNDELGIKGLAQTMYDSGIRIPGPRYVGDNVTSFMADTLERLPKAQKDAFLESFRENVGKHLPDYKNATMEDVANLMAYQTSVAGQQLNIFSNVSKIFKANNVNPETGTIGEALDLLNPEIKGVLGSTLKDEPRSISFYQNNLIQSIVSHPGTTMLNIMGSTQRGFLDTMSDAVQASLYTGIGMRGFLTGDYSDIRRGVKMFKAIGNRTGRIMAPDANAAEFEDYMAIRPNAEKALFRFLSGGVENEDVLKAFNMDKAGPINQMVARGMNSYKDFAQALYLTQLQDRFFKTQNFMYSLDKRLAQEFGENYATMMSRPDIVEIMNSPRYAATEMKAVEDTLLGVFGKSYSSRETFAQNPIHAVATMIEEVRRVPIVGAALPFGQFFMGTVDFMSDYTGVKFIYRLAGAGEGRSKAALTESASKAAVGLTAVMALSLREDSYIDLGLSWDQELDSDGTIVSKAYDFPGSFFKMLGRMVAHQRRDGSVPPELQKQFAETFGVEAFTRNIQGSSNEFIKNLGAAFDGNPMEAAKGIAGVMATEVGAAWISGYTRPIDPINQISGLTQEDGTIVFDRNQGNKFINQSFRYVDQIFEDVLLGLGSEELQTATQEQPATEIGKIFGYRSVPSQSNTQRIMNAIDKPTWTGGFSTGNEKLDNRLNELVFKHIEPRATQLVRNKNWDSLPADVKRAQVNAAWTAARAAARKELAVSPLVEDSKSAAIEEVIRKADSQRLLNQAMRELGMDKDLYEYNAAQIRSILNVLAKIEDRQKLQPFRE